MVKCWTAACVAMMLCAALAQAVTDQEFTQLKSAFEKSQETQKQIVIGLARQVMQQQLYVEEMTRSTGDSGLKKTRLSRTGSKSYFDTTYSGSRIASIHEHSNYIGTVGMGELLAVLNGVEFRTRHNDYKMRMPSRTSKDYGATEDIPYPAVPPQVLAKPTVEEQIKEMREWFKAWQSGDYSKRDYRKYFKANLCYLEGQWTNAKDGAIDEPFASARHSIDAKNFFDLTEKIRYTSVTGRKSTKENYAYLPTTIADVDEHGNVMYSQWNYRILCHPIKKDVPVTRLRLEDDLATRVANGKSLDDHMKSRSARFSFYEDPADKKFFKTKDTLVKTSQGTFLDDIMGEIPGRDNYPANIVDDGFGQIIYKPDASLPRFPSQSVNFTLPKPLNAGYYHNAHKVIGNDAMGVSIRRRGFSDANLYVAYNTRDKVTPITVQGKCSKKNPCKKAARLMAKRCKRANDICARADAASKAEKVEGKCPSNAACLRNAKNLQRACQRSKGKNCKPIPKCPKPPCPSWTSRVSYAIPLELIFTTPLQRWNPYKLPRQPKTSIPSADKRSGYNSLEKAYNGTSTKHYFLTPIDFYESGKAKSRADSADTVKRGAVAVLDNKGTIRLVTQSGISISTKNIPGVGPVRIRYPVMPLHDSGNNMYKEIKALSDMTLRKNKYAKLYPDVRVDNGTIEEMYEFQMGVSTRDPPGPHVHTLELSQSEVDDILAGKPVKVSTSEVSGHEHELELYYNSGRQRIDIKKCDGQRNCWDGHSRLLDCPECRFKFTKPQ